MLWLEKSCSRITRQRATYRVKLTMLLTLFSHVESGKIESRQTFHPLCSEIILVMMQANVALLGSC